MLQYFLRKSHLTFSLLENNDFNCILEYIIAYFYIFVNFSLIELIFHFTADDEKSSKEDPDLDVPTLPRIEVVRRLRERYLDKLFSNHVVHIKFSN